MEIYDNLNDSSVPGAMTYIEAALNNPFTLEANDYFDPMSFARLLSLDSLDEKVVNPNEIQPNESNYKALYKSIASPATPNTNNSTDDEASNMSSVPSPKVTQEFVEHALASIRIEGEKSNEEEANDIPSQMRLRSTRVVVKKETKDIPRYESSSSKTKRCNGNPKDKKDKKMKNCKHIWQFLRDELQKCLDQQNVEWIDKRKGVFKVINQNRIAKKWEDYKVRKSKLPMDYEKMSRGIRHSRKDNYFQFIDKENQTYGVKLIYQFGYKAIENCKWLSSFVELD